MKSINDLDLNKWKEYKDILTGSLWIIDERDKSGSHKGDYHGNFIPQIPNQLIRRFTKKNDVILDTFLGSGTTLIECKMLGRNGIGIELLPSIAKLAAGRIKQGSLFNGENNFFEVVTGDSTQKSVRKKVDKVLKNNNKESVQLIVMHPPYHDIIKFSKRPEDLSNAKSIEEFTNLFNKAVSNFTDLLDSKRYLAIVIGDKYSDSQWVPLGFYVMNEVLTKNKDLILKSILVKNMVNSRGKRNQNNLWHYRALVGGFYIFKHEYILLFQKK